MWRWLTAWRGREPDRARKAASLEPLKPVSWRRQLLWMVVIFATVVALCSFLDLGALDYFEQYAYNARLAIYGARHGSLTEQARRQIVLVTLSDDSFTQLPGPPVPRDYHAKVIGELTRAGAKVIAVDLVLDVERPGDDVLAAAAHSSGRVVWASVFEHEGTPEQREVLPVPCLQQASLHWGHIHVPQDPDILAVDCIEAVIDHGGRHVPALSVETARLALGLGDEPLRPIREGWRLGDLTIPVDGQGRLSIRYVGKPQTVFPTVPYEQVYEGAVDDPFYQENRFFRDKVVLVGDTTTVGNDHRLTPVGDMWGVEIHAHAIATILQRGFLRKAPTWLNLAAITLVTALVCGLAAACHLKRAMLTTGSLLLGYMVLNVWLFVDHGLWLHLFAPTSAAALAILGVTAQRSLTEEREKRRMHGLLQRYVSSQVAEHIIASPNAYILGGVETTATVLFADIRGFTAMAEKLSPTRVVECLNLYFEVMTNVVLEHDGAVDKYMGDCIMALFGVPVPHDDHPRRAVVTALEMQSGLRELRERCRVEGLPVADIGIGINTGPMVVGNIGSERRLDFTVIGDAVNLAQRLESLNKDLGTQILVSEATYNAVAQTVRVRGPLRAAVRGREEEVIVYEVVGWTEAGGDGVAQKHG